MNDNKTAEAVADQLVRWSSDVRVGRLMVGRVTVDGELNHGAMLYGAAPHRDHRVTIELRGDADSERDRIVAWLELQSKLLPDRHMSAVLSDACKRAEADRDAWKARAEEMRAVLERCETSGGDVAGNAVCPICCEDVDYDEAGERVPCHAADCALAKVLGR